MKDPYIAVGYHKGEMDFSIAATVCDLDFKEMNDLRQMIVVAIGTMEDMWRRERERRTPTATPPPPAAKENWTPEAVKEAVANSEVERWKRRASAAHDEQPAERKEAK